VNVLPFDCSRCVGVSTDEGELVSPCNQCRRILWAKPQGPRSPWIAPERNAHGHCPNFWSVNERVS